MHVYGVQNIVTSEVKNEHVVCFRLYADKDLDMTVALKEMFQHAFTQDEFVMARIVNISQAEDGQGFDIKVDWVRFNEGEKSCEPLATIRDGSFRIQSLYA